MIDQNLKNYVTKPFVKAIVGLIVIEQLANAAGTAFLGLAGKSLSSFQNLSVFLIGYFIVTHIPSLVYIYLRRIEARGFIDAYQIFLEKRLFRLAGRTSVWSNRQQRESYLTAIGAEAENHLTATLFTHYDFLGYLLGILANSAALALVIDANFGWIFFISMGLSFALYRAREPKLHDLVEREQQRRLALSANVLNAWDNVLLNNKPVQRRYQKLVIDKFAATRDLAGQAAHSAASLVFWMAIASSLPVFLFNGVLAYRNFGDAAFLAALIITLPRQMYVLQTFRALFQQLTNLKIFSSRLNTVIENSEITVADLSARIDVTKIRLNGSAVTGLEELWDAIKNRTTGRLLISGMNGAGKSSLLLLMNERLSDSLYLPPSPNLEIGEAGAVSTGQNLRRHLNYLFAQSSPVVLLDEWDANLDGENRNEISSHIDAAAQSRLIVEVRHRV